MMKKRTLIALLLVFLFIAGVSFLVNSRKEIDFRIIYIKDKPFIVEIADTDKKRIQGLSQRRQLGENQGMLFIFENEAVYPFWMKDMLFPIDIIWIKENSVVDISENVPITLNSKESDLETYISSQPVDKVLEVNAGAVKGLGIRVGDKIAFENPKF